MSDDPDPLFEAGPPHHEGPVSRDHVVERGRLVPPTLSIAIVVGIALGLIGVGLGYRLGLDATVAPPEVSPAPSRVALSSFADLQPDRVSGRLELATAASAPWAICELGPDVVCRTLDPAVSFSPAVQHTFDFKDSDVARLNPPAIARGHLALATALGEGDITGSLVHLGATADRTRSQALVPIDPGRSGVEYFDLGPLDSGEYAVVIGFVSRSPLGSPESSLATYLAGFVVSQ
jgi:hypothetical protein